MQVLARHTLQRFAARKYPDAEGSVLAQLIIEELRTASATFDDEVCDGYRWLLELDRRHRGTAPRRREEAIKKFKLNQSVETFRRAESDEMDKCRELAEVLYVQLTQ